MEVSAFKNIAPDSENTLTEPTVGSVGLKKGTHIKSGRKGSSAGWRGVQGEGIEEDLIKTQYMHACMKFSNKKNPQFNFYWMDMKHFMKYLLRVCYSKLLII